jgi:hypothetical protein
MAYIARQRKCEFSVKKVGFLGFVVSPDGIEMEADRIATIEDWPTPKSVKDVQVLMGFTNFYRRCNVRSRGSLSHT